ncbi:DUF4277 domain-containing protein [Candidatus Poribacteria bacterium]|nr:DUF4277 domain-containing protein [Candidatus Poribacteria bacterium]
MNLTTSSDMTSDFYPLREGWSVDKGSHICFLKESNSPLYLHEASIERIDDIPLLWALQKRITLDNVIDSAIPRHWSHQGRSIGQLVMGWNTFILSQGDHRQVTVHSWVAHHRTVLEELLGQPIRDTDFTDDRLGQVLTAISDETAWQAIEDQLWRQSIQVYSITPQCVRLDATTVSGYHTVSEETLMQFGYNKDHHNQPQVQVMAGSIDDQSNGHLVALEVVQGQTADASLYQPVLLRLRDILQHKGLLYMGDSKMSALAIRTDIVRHGDFYLLPLAEVGERKKLLSDCIKKVVLGNQPTTLIYAPNSKNAVVSRESGLSSLPEKGGLLAAGDETFRPMISTFPNGESIAWTERLLVIRSYSEAEKEQALLFKRLVQAEQALLALTPEPKRGRRQIRSEDQLH